MPHTYTQFSSDQITNKYKYAKAGIQLSMKSEYLSDATHTSATPLPLSAPQLTAVFEEVAYGLVVDLVGQVSAKEFSAPCMMLILSARVKSINQSSNDIAGCWCSGRGVM
jgi:hypothetical protein